MKFHLTAKTALKGLATNKSRSSLTILGIVIGITAIILIMSLGKGAQDLILSQIQGLGSRTIIVIPGREPRGPSDAAQIFSDSLKEKDLEALKKTSNIPGAKIITPLIFGGESIAYEGETYRATLFGGGWHVMDLFDLIPETGSFFTEEDVKSYADVVVIGAKVKKQLFGASEPIGQKVKIKTKNFRVIGVLPLKGQVSFFNFDETALIPYTTAQKYIFGIKYFHRFIIEANADNNIPQTVLDIETTLRNSHDIIDPNKDDFFVETQADLANRVGVITNILTLFLLSVAAISLVVGGIGIMNIMLVSVTERTSEIGLRKAVGAKNSDILLQFLVEAIILTLAGGIIGISIGTLFSFIISLVLGNIVGLAWKFTFPFSSAIIGLAVSAVIGLVFGLYPAKKAARKSPMEALRYE